MRILFAGTPDTAASVLLGLLKSGHEVVAVLTREDSPIGRKRILTPSPVADLASQRGIPVVKANKVDSVTLNAIREHKADLAIVVAYGVILREEALQALPVGWFNLHFSVLPRWRGAAPVQRALQNGDGETGVTLFKIDSGLDTGPIVASLPTLINPEENAGDLLSRLSILGVSLLNQELPKIYSGTHTLTEQSGEVSLAPKTSREEAKIDFSADSKSISNLVRAMNPEPMAWCFLNEEPMRVLSARASRLSISNPELGTVVMADNQVLVTCGLGTALELLEVQPASRNAMKARDWLNGSTSQVNLQ